MNDNYECTYVHILYTLIYIETITNDRFVCQIANDRYRRGADSLMTDIGVAPTDEWPISAWRLRVNDRYPTVE